MYLKSLVSLQNFTKIFFFAKVFAKHFVFAKVFVKICKKILFLRKSKVAFWCQP